MSEFQNFLALEASAGSGKTFALSVRFVALILMGAKMNEILALTFTKKAANEMQKRVIDTFLNFHKAEKSAECLELCKILNKNKEELINLRDARKEEFLQQDLKISTFDAFFAKILRAFALNLGFMSDFSTSENELNLSAVFLKNLNPEQMKNLAYYIVSSNDKEDFFKELESLYQNAYFKDFSLGTIPNKAKLDEAYKELRTCVLGFDNIYLNKTFKEQNLDLDAFLKSSFMNKFDEETPKYLEKLKENPYFLECRENFIRALNDYATELENSKISKLMELLEHFTEAKKIIHKEKNTLSFSDISRNVYELIKSDFKDMIYFRLDGRISHLLIDEFQDTNVLQYEILKPIIEELVSGEGVKKFRSFFYVGDKKQSIYGFRKSKKELFDLVRKQFPQIKLASLDINYRSCGNLVGFVNEIFKEKFPFYLNQKIPEDKPQDNGFVRIVQSQESESSEIKEKTLEALKTQLEFLRSEGVDWNDVCILCWKNDDADMILDFLKQEKIPAFTQSNVLLENKASVRLVLEYGKYCIFGDAFYLEFLYALLGFKPQRLKLDLCRSASENILYLIKKLKLDLSDTALIQFIEYAQDKENFLELLFEPCALKILSEENLGISIMTVHKSKGLEFKNVILLDLLSKLNVSSDSIMLEYDVSLGWELKIRDKIRQSTKEKNYTAFLEKIQKSRLEDDINKLYVAFTRAKNSLIVIKRNMNSVDKAYPSYFNSKEFLELPCKEIGSFISENKENIQVKFPFKDVLKPFVKVPLQELDVKEKSYSHNIYFGNAFHFFMQNVKFDSSNFQKLCEKTKEKFRHFLNSKDFENIFKRVENLLKDTNFQSLIKNKKLFKEQTLSFEGEIKQVDLLALSRTQAFVFDYKTGRNDEQSHILQVQNYKLALKEILKKEQTRAFLVYCLSDKIELVEL